MGNWYLERPDNPGRSTVAARRTPAARPAGGTRSPAAAGSFERPGTCRTAAAAAPAAGAGAGAGEPSILRSS